MFPILISVVFAAITVSARVQVGVELSQRKIELEDLNSTGVFLTPFIENNELAAGRKAAFVTPLLGDVESYAGFLTVNSTSNSNMFFWFFPAEMDSAKAPVALWLQGGPGGPSLYGLFHENGPFKLLENLTLEKRCHRWTRTINMIYIDNPVGTGFSFTDDESAYARDETDVGRDLYNALVQFFTLFPAYRTNPFFITGESYAGKYIPALGYYIHTHNPTASLVINLKGVAIGNGWVDPQNMMDYSEYLYQNGLIDYLTLAEFRKEEAEVRKEIENENWEKASTARHYIIHMIEYGLRINIYNCLLDDAPLLNYTPEYFENSDVRRRIHVGNATFHDGIKVKEYLYNDYPKSVVPWLEVLINNYRVVLYSGQHDVIVGYPLTLNFVHKMKWNGSEEYKNAERVLWRVKGELAGFAKSGGNFTEVLVRKAGHMVISDQPLYAFDLITRVVGGISFDENIEMDEFCET